MIRSTEKDLIYILGSGRSGTTLVDILLGNDKTIFSAGELNRIPKRRGCPPARNPGDQVYEFWSAITNRLILTSDWGKIQSLSEKCEYHSGFFKRHAPLDTEYVEFLKDLFKNLSDEVEEKVIVDSSKYPMRAYHLSNLFPKELKYCIYLKKHPVSVLRSFKKTDLEQPAKSWFAVCAYLVVVHLLSRWVIEKLQRKGVKVLTASFEQVVDDPLQFVRDVSDKFDLDLSDLLAKLEKKDPLMTNYLFDGNRIRLKKELVIEPHKPPTNWTLKERFVYVCNRFWWIK